MYILPAVLELEPHYLKAIMRRGQASEALEKYEDALEGRILYSGMHMCVCVYVCCCMTLIFEVYITLYMCIIKNTWLHCIFVVTDYKKALEIDPSQDTARKAVMVSD